MCVCVCVCVYKRVAKETFSSSPFSSSLSVLSRHLGTIRILQPGSCPSLQDRVHRIQASTGRERRMTETQRKRGREIETRKRMKRNRKDRDT